MSNLDLDDNRTLLRAVFAGIALHGLISGGVGAGARAQAAALAVQYADELLEELETDEVEEPEAGVAALKTRRKYK